MQNCVNDFTPIITAIAGLITIQFPVIISLFINQRKIRNDVKISKGLNITNDKRYNNLTGIIYDGLYQQTHGKHPQPGRKMEVSSEVKKDTSNLITN